jgi:AcrR family transcriptional regulator
LSEHTRSARTYRMSKRADDVAETRRRIVEATVRLHETVGPAATTISAIAKQAGVTRLTVYRHFPDERALFAACGAQWASGQVLPDPESWTRIPDPVQRLRTALSDLYRFYRAAEPMLTSVQRDRSALPEELRAESAAAEARQREILLEPFPVRGRRRARLRAVLGHAMSFDTWRSLCRDHGLSDRDAIRTMLDLVHVTTAPRV